MDKPWLISLIVKYTKIIKFFDRSEYYFRNENYTNSITDEITTIMGSGTIRQDFIGYNVLTLRKREEMIQKPFKICKLNY